MKRLDLLAFVAAGVGLRPLAAAAQRTAKIPRIGYLSGAAHLREAFLQGLRDLGYVEGRNVEIEIRDPEGNYDRLAPLSAELVALGVDVIVVTSTPSTIAAKNATKSIPIVFTWAVDPVESGLVASLANPGGNVTGLSTQAPELVGKRLELLKEAVPALARIAVLWHPGDYGERIERSMLDDVADRARRLNFGVAGGRGARPGGLRPSRRRDRRGGCASGYGAVDQRLLRRADAPRRPDTQTPPPGGVFGAGVCRYRRAHVVCAEYG